LPIGEGFLSIKYGLSKDAHNGENMTLEEAQIAWLQADTKYKLYLAKRGINEQLSRAEKMQLKEDKELEVAMPKLRPIPNVIGSDMPW
jgi:hypothetical protein